MPPQPQSLSFIVIQFSVHCQSNKLQFREAGYKLNYRESKIETEVTPGKQYAMIQRWIENPKAMDDI